MSTQAQVEASDRLAQYLEARKILRDADPEQIHGIGTMDGLVFLNVSDIRSVLDEIIAARRSISDLTWAQCPEPGY